MLHMQDELVSALQQDRRREVETARKMVPLSTSDTSQPRLVLALSAMLRGLKRSPTRIPSGTQTTASTNVT